MRRRRKGLAAGFLAILLAAVVGTAHAADSGREAFTKPLTLEKAIEYGLAHNRIFLAAKQEVNAVGQQVRQAKADFFPKVDTNYTFRRMDDQPYATLTGLALPSGATSMTVPTAHSTTNHWEIDMTQPLFTGFGLTARYNMAKMDRKIAEYHLDETRLNITRDIHRAFLQILLAEKLVQVAQDNVKSLQIQRRNAEAQYEQGLTAKNDVLKAEVSLSQALQQERAVAKQLAILRSRLNQLLDLDLQTNLELSEEDIHSRKVPSLEVLYSTAEKQRPEYQAMGTSIQQAEQGVTAAKSRYYPRVSLFALYYREGEDFLADRNDYTNEHNAAVGIKVDWNWFEGGKTDAAQKEWRYRQASLAEKRDDLRQQIRLQVEDSFEQLKVASANIDTAGAALKQAEENERMTSLQYKEQMVIFLEVLNAQNFMAQSRADYYQALYGYQLAWADLERAVGGRIRADQTK